jgi:hypothetical protein
MNPRFKGLGKVIFLVPLLLAILLRMFTEEEESNRGTFLCVLFALSGVITLVVGLLQDKNTGIDVFSRKAWSSELMESQHLFFYMPLRLVGILALVFSPLFLLL